MENDKRNVPKHKIKDFGTIFFVMVFFPYIINLLFHGISPEEEQKERLNDTLVLVATSIGYEKLPLEEYLIGALAANIDLNYEDEALKAQTILLRTAVIYERMEHTKDANNMNENINAVSQESVKQSYWTVADMQERFGENFKESYSRLKDIVDATDNIILTYKGSPIETPFFAISAGKTRSGKEAFGSSEYPYLQSVACENDILSENYMHNYSFEKDKIKEIFLKEEEKQAQENAVSENAVSGNAVSENTVSENTVSENIVSENEIPENEEDDLSITIEKTDSAGYALSVKVGNGIFTGEEFRRILHLNSSNITIENSKKGVLIQTNGLGHGIGMSQYAADHLAKNGNDFVEILSYFFTDTEIDKN